MGHAACEVMLESKASCEDDQKKQVYLFRTFDVRSLRS